MWLEVFFGFLEVFVMYYKKEFGQEQMIVIVDK